MPQDVFSFPLCAIWKKSKSIRPSVFIETEIPRTEELVNQYRNRAAHGEVLSQAEAAACYQIMGIADHPAAHAQLGEIEGALQALLWLTDPLK